MDERNCNNCGHQTKLVMWERNKKGQYRPNYKNRLTCCTACVGLDGYSGTVYGHTERQDEGFCELWKEKI